MSQVPRDLEILLDESEALLERCYPILSHYIGCPEAEKAFNTEVADLIVALREYLGYV